MPVDWITVGNQRELVSGIKGALTDIVVRLQIQISDVAILSGSRIEGHPIVERNAISGYPFSPAGADTDGRLVFDTIRRFKGLEKPVVFLIDIDRIIGHELPYIGLTRASILMKVFSSRTSIADIREGQARAAD